jgi:hypothetical protein
VPLPLRGEGPRQLSQKRPLALVSILQSLAAAEIANALHLRDFRIVAIFEFFNTIGTNRTSRAGLTMSVDGGRTEVADQCPKRRE